MVVGTTGRLEITSVKVGFATAVEEVVLGTEDVSATERSVKVGSWTVALGIGVLFGAEDVASTGSIVVGMTIGVVEELVERGLVTVTWVVIV